MRFARPRHFSRTEPTEPAKSAYYGLPYRMGGNAIAPQRHLLADLQLGRTVCNWRAPVKRRVDLRTIGSADGHGCHR